MDVKTAFLNGELEEKNCMVISQTLSVTMILRRKKPVYHENVFISTDEVFKFCFEKDVNQPCSFS